MSVLAHANHPEMFIAGLVAGAVIVLATVVYKRAKK